MNAIAIFVLGITLEFMAIFSKVFPEKRLMRLFHGDYGKVFILN